MHDADGNRVAEYDYDPATQISTLLREYVWMNGENVAVVEGGVVYYVRTDHIGRPVFATDDSGTKVWEASYLPFGGVHTSTGNNSELRFPGQWFQSEAGLHQNWMRDYDPTTGRYIQADPLGLVDGPSVYGYALQNPMRFMDFRGERVDPANPFGVVERSKPKDCGIQVAGVGDFCKRHVDKLKGLPKVLALVCGVAFGADNRPETNWPRRGPGRNEQPGTQPPNEDRFTNQPLPPKKDK